MTLKEIEKEARRRVDEDGCARIVYLTTGAKLGICLLDDWVNRPILDRGVSIVWPDKIESLI